jgi:hypothetical protein
MCVMGAGYVPWDVSRSIRPPRVPPSTRQWSLSQREDHLADGGGLGEEGVVAGVEFHDAAGATGELTL